MSKKTLNILSIDGGGIKGLYSAKILAVFEKRYNIKMFECFDLICGTSTGGLIALALATGKSAEDIVRIYRDKANTIFPNSCNPSIEALKQCFFGSKYCNNGLKEVLNEIFGNNRLEDAKTNLCIPTINLNTCSPQVFKTGHSKKYVRDPQILMKEVALTTTAAPTFFPIATIDSFRNDFIDGGLWANNPSLVGITEALKCFVGSNSENAEFETFNLLSIASVEENIARPISKKKDNSYASWNYGKDLVSTFMQVQNKSTHHLTAHFCNNLPLDPKPIYVRIPSPELSSAQAKLIRMDSSQREALDTLETLGQDKGYEYCDNPHFDISVFCRNNECLRR